VNYYNEFDPKAAAWLRELIREGLIPPGHVDERSIIDVRAADLAGYDQCHFFAGIGGWSRAFFLAGIAGKKGRWTGSCPCQPFSDAGEGLGTADPRHLWPHLFRLIRECRPNVVYGEQVASKAALAWLDGVFDDLEGAGYACGAADFSSAVVGAPHIRQRLYWVAHRNSERLEVGKELDQPSHESSLGTSRRTDVGGCGGVGGLGEPDSLGSPAGVSGPLARNEGLAGVTDDAGDQTSTRERERERRTAWLVHPERTGLEGHSGHEHDRDQPRWIIQEPGRPAPEAGAACFWSPSDLIECTDGKSRRTKSSIFPLAHGIPGRVALLRGAGNAINPIQAACFIEACEDAMTARPSMSTEQKKRPTIAELEAILTLP
jgi:DNA (cytosine-5)-methyltransferase 1